MSKAVTLYVGAKAKPADANSSCNTFFPSHSLSGGGLLDCGRWRLRRPVAVRVLDAMLVGFVAVPKGLVVAW